MDITRAQIQQLGLLARLELTDQEVERLHGQLPTIVTYVSQLQDIDTTTVALSTPVTMVLRADEAQTSPAGAAILDQAPEHSERFWKVDAVFS